MAYVIFLDIQGDTALREIVAFDPAHIGSLTLRKQRQVHFRNYGKSAVDVNDPYQSVDAAGLVYVMPLGPGFAETECAVSKTLRFLHDPHVLMLEHFRSERRGFSPAVFGQINPEIFGV